MKYSQRHGEYPPRIGYEKSIEKPRRGNNPASNAERLMSTTFIHSLCDASLSLSLSVSRSLARSNMCARAGGYLLSPREREGEGERERERGANISVFMLLQRPTNYATRPTDRPTAWRALPSAAATPTTETEAAKMGSSTDSDMWAQSTHASPSLPLSLCLSV